MHINCKCGERLTSKSMYPAKDWHCYADWSETFDDGEYWEDKKYEIKSGTFLLQKKDKDCWWSRECDRILVHPDYVKEDIVPKFKEGMGCCDVSCYIYCPSCKAKVGGADLDCWQSRNVSFKMNQCVRSYK